MKDDIRSRYEKYVANIDVSQRLYECGFRQNCMFFWVANPILDTLNLYQDDMEYQGSPQHRFAAPTSVEIKEAFPQEVWITTKHRSIIRRHGIFHFLQHKGKHIVSLVIKSDDTHQVYEVHREEEENEANALGNMYCFIYENHLHELRS